MNYLIGNKKEFYDFVDGILDTDKIGIFTHTDLDGIASGIFLQKILESRGLKPDFIEFLEYKQGMFTEAIENKSVNKLFVSDLNLDEFLEEYDFIKKKCDVFLVDHHPLSEDLEDRMNIIKTESKACSAHCLFDLAKDYFNTSDWEWLVCSAMISDMAYKKKENLEFIHSLFPDVTAENILDSVPGKIAQKISSALIYYLPNYREVYDLVLEKDFESFKKVDKIIKDEINFFGKKFIEEAEFSEKNNLRFYYFEPKFKIASIIATRISDMKEGIFVVASPSFMNDGKIKISARDQSGKVNVSELLKTTTKGFENADAGGHFKAAAANILEKDFEKFKERLMN